MSEEEGSNADGHEGFADLIFESTTKVAPAPKDILTVAPAPDNMITISDKTTDDDLKLLTTPKAKVTNVATSDCSPSSAHSIVPLFLQQRIPLQQWLALVCYQLIHVLELMQ